MADLTPRITIPTGFEEQQRRLELRQRLADALLQAGMTQQGRYGSPLQVIGQMLQGAAGQHMENKVSKEYGDLEHQIRSSYIGARAEFTKDVNSGMPAQALVQKYGDNPFLEDDLKPYTAALSHGLSSQENIVHTPVGYKRAGDVVNQPEFDPNKMLIPNGQGGYTVNLPRVAAAQMSQGFNIPPGLSTSLTLQPPNATQGQPPIASPTPPAGGLSPSSAPAGGVDLSLLSPQERQILTDEIKRRAAMSSQQQGMHGPQGVTPPPSGVSKSGKPYWIVNGVPYDNPEGK